MTAINNDFRASMATFTAKLQKCREEENQKEVIQNFYDILPNPLKALFLDQFPSHKGTDGPDKLLALEVAEVIGPARAQELYHFIVLVTKLA